MSLGVRKSSQLWKQWEVDESGPTTDWEFTTARPSPGSSPPVVSPRRQCFLDSETDRSLLRDLVLPESSASDMLEFLENRGRYVEEAKGNGTVNTASSSHERLAAHGPHHRRRSMRHRSSSHEILIALVLYQ